MDKKEIARKVANYIFYPHDEDETEFAIQLFVERVVLPDSVDGYSKKEIEEYILKYLEG